MKGKVSLFVPCFVDQLLPQVAVDTVKVLRRVGYEVEYPEDQTCCGQPAFNTGYWNEARPCAERFVRVFKHAEVVGIHPSGSCVTMVRNFYPELLADSPLREEALAVSSRTFELSEFLVKVAAVTQVGASFPHSVTYHASCHGLRELHLRDEPLQLLREVKGLKRASSAVEECCGFGGTFAMKFADISAAMGTSKAENATATEAEFVTAIDPSCLLHIQGILGKRKAPIRAIHLASILAQERP